MKIGAQPCMKRWEWKYSKNTEQIKLSGMVRKGITTTNDGKSTKKIKTFFLFTHIYKTESAHLDDGTNESDDKNGNTRTHWMEDNELLSLESEKMEKSCIFLFLHLFRVSCFVCNHIFFFFFVFFHSSWFHPFGSIRWTAFFAKQTCMP